MTVLHAPDGRSGIETLRATPGIDIVLMDLRSFSATNFGCILELQVLIDRSPEDGDRSGNGISLEAEALDPGGSDAADHADDQAGRDGDKQHMPTVGAQESGGRGQL